MQKTLMLYFLWRFAGNDDKERMCSCPIISPLLRVRPFGEAAHRTDPKGAE